MLAAGAPLDWAWVDVAVPRDPGRLPGVGMAGFRYRAPALATLAMVAHPSLTLIIDLGEGQGLLYDAHGRPERGSILAGLLPGAMCAAGREGECLEIRLSPVTAAAVLGPATDLTGTVASLEEVWGHDLQRLEDRLRATTSWDERFTIASGAIGRRMRDRRRVDPEVSYAWRRTFVSRGRIRVEGLANDVGWSRKRLWARFRSELGITPKRAAQLVRFDHAAHLLAAGHPVASVATESGYVDQAHLHHEAKAFAGLTPAGVAAAPWLAIDDVAWPTRPHSSAR